MVGDPKCQKCGGWLTPFVSAGKVEHLCIQCQAAAGAFGKPQLGLPPSSPPLSLAKGSADAEKRKFTLGFPSLSAAVVYVVAIVVAPFVATVAVLDTWLGGKIRKFPEAYRIMRGIACTAIGAAFGAWLDGIFVSILFGWICAMYGFHDYRPFPESGRGIFIKPGDKSDFKEAPPVVRDFRAEIQSKVMHADKTARESKYPIAAMHVAAQMNNASVIAALVERGDDINVRNHAGWTPLHYAKYYNSRSAYTALIEHGADKDAKADNGETPTTLLGKFPGDIRPMTNEEQLRFRPPKTPARW